MDPVMVGLVAAAVLGALLKGKIFGKRPKSRKHLKKRVALLLTEIAEARAVLERVGLGTPKLSVAEGAVIEQLRGVAAWAESCLLPDIAAEAEAHADRYLIHIDSRGPKELRPVAPLAEAQADLVVVEDAARKWLKRTQDPRGDSLLAAES